MSESYLPEQLVFVDECSSDRRIRRDRGCSMCGERAHKKVVFLRGRRYTQSFGFVLRQVSHGYLADSRSCLLYPLMESSM